VRKFFQRRRRSVLLCSLCGREIPWGDVYWYVSGHSVCEACLPEFAREELAGFRLVRGEERSL